MAKIYIESTDATITISGPSSLLPLPGQTIGAITAVLNTASATVDLSSLSAAAAENVTVSVLKASTAYTYVADAATGMVKVMDGATTVATLPVAADSTTTNIQFTDGVAEITVSGTGVATVGTPAGGSTGEGTFLINDAATAAGTDAGGEVARLTGDTMARIDITNPLNEVKGLDTNNDGVISNNGVENAITGVASKFEIFDAYARNPLNQGDITKNYIGDISFDGTGYAGDGTNTDGNIYLGGLGVDQAFGGIGSDFLAGGGVAAGRFVPTVNAAGVNIVMDTLYNKAVPAGMATADYLQGGRNADFFFSEISALDPTDGNGARYDGGETADNVTGTQNVLTDASGVTNDRDWLLPEASDDNEPVTINLADAAGAMTARTSTTGVGPAALVANLVGVENVNASGNLYGMLNNVAVSLGARSVDSRSTAPVVGTENYGIGSTGQLAITDLSGSANTIIGGFDNDTVTAAGGNDILFGGDLEYLLRNKNNPNLLTATGGLDLNALNNAKVVSDGRDALNGGDDNDAIVFEADGGSINGNNGFDTLYFTNQSVGRVQGTEFTDTYVDTAAQDAALKAATTDQMVRLDLDNGIAGQFRDYGGANRGLGIAPTVPATADQINYIAGQRNNTTNNMDGVIATGLGDIDYKAAGSNSPELQFSNQQNYQGSNQKFDVRGVDADAISTTMYGTYWTDANFGQDATNGILDNADMVVGSATISFRDTGDNVIYTAIANDTIEGRNGDDDLSGNKGDDNFIFDFGDDTDIIRRQSDNVDVNGNKGADNIWDTDAAGVRLYQQDFRADPSGITATRLQIDFETTDLTSPNVAVGSVQLTINPGKADAVKLTSGDVTATHSITELAAAVNTAFAAIDAKISVIASGNSLIVSDTGGRDISDTVAEGYGVFVAIGNSAASTKATLNPGGNVIQENDRVLFVDYLDRVNNSWVNNATDELRNQAQDLVVGTGTTTTLANAQEWRMQFQNLAEGDSVAVNINGTIFTRTVAATQTTDQFIASLVAQINTSTLDLYTAAGTLAAAQADVNAANTRESVLVLTQGAIGTGENKVYMNAPTATITAVSGAASSASWQVANTSATSIELLGFDGRDGNINGTDVLFLGRSAQTAVATDNKTEQTAQNTSILQFAKNTGETLTGKDATVVLRPSALTNEGNNNGNALRLYHAVNGDDQLIGGTGNDTLNGGTGDDRFIGSKGTDVVNGGGNSTAPNGESIRYRDSIIFQESDFGTGSKFTITMDPSLDASGAGTVTAVSSAAATLGTTTFSAIEEIRTASNTAQDTLDYSGLSNNVAAATGASANQDQAALVLPTVAATNYNEGTLLNLTATNAGFAFAEDRNGDDDTSDSGEISSNPVAVFGIENVIGGAANDIVVMDKSQAGSVNNISLAGEQSDLTLAGTYIEGRDLVTYTHATLLGNESAGVAGVWETGDTDNRPTITVTPESGSNLDTVAATGGALGTATIIDNLTNVEYLDIAAAATNKSAADVLDMSKISGATVNFNAGAVLVGRSLGGQLTANSVANVEANTFETGSVVATAGPLGNELIEITGITQLERVTGSAGTDRIIVGDGTGFTNANFNLASTTNNDQSLALNFHSKYNTATRDYTKTGFNVDNRLLYQFNLGDGTDSLDYRQSTDGVAVLVDFNTTATAPGDYVVVDHDNAGYFGDGTLDRIDLAQNVERYYGAVQAGANNVIDLSQASEAVTVTFGVEALASANEVKDPNGTDPNAGATKTPDNQVTSASVATTANLSSVLARFMEASANAATATGEALWERIEGSNQADTVVLSQYQDRNADETFNLRGGSNIVDYTNAVKTGQADSYTFTLGALNASAVLGTTTAHNNGTVTHTSTDTGAADVDTITIDRQVSLTNAVVDGALLVRGSSNTTDTVTIAAFAGTNFSAEADGTGITGLGLTGAANDLTGFKMNGTAATPEEAVLVDVVGRVKGGYHLADLGSGVGTTTGTLIQDVNLNFKGAAAVADNVITSVAGFENITGSAENDRLFGNDNNNTITGGGGNDIYQGRGGGDALTLGAGADRVVYSGPGDTADIVGDTTTVAGEYDTVTAFDTAGADRILFDLTVTTANGGFNLVNNGIQSAGIGGTVTAANGGIVLIGDNDIVLAADALNMTKVVTGLGTAATLSAGVAIGTQMIFAVDTTDKVGLYLWTAGTAADTTVAATELRLLSQFQDDNDVQAGLSNTTVQTGAALLTGANFAIATGAVLVEQGASALAADAAANVDAYITKDFTAAQANGTTAVFALESAVGTAHLSYWSWVSANADAVVDAAELTLIGTNMTVSDITAVNAAAIGAEALAFAQAALLGGADAGVDVFAGADIAIRRSATSSGVADTVLLTAGVRDEITYSALNQSQYGQIDTLGRFIGGNVTSGFEAGTDKIDLSGFNLGAVDGLAVNAIIVRGRTGAGSQITDANANDFFYDANNVRRAVVVEYDNDDIDAGTAGIQARARVFVDLNGNGQLDTTQDLFIDLATNGTSAVADGNNTIAGVAGTFVPSYQDFLFIV